MSFVRLNDVNALEICLLLFPFTLNNISELYISREEDYSAKFTGQYWNVVKHHLRLSTAGAIVKSNENVNDIVKV